MKKITTKDVKLKKGEEIKKQPSFDQYLLPILEVIYKSSEISLDRSNKQFLKTVQGKVGLSDEMRQELMQNQLRTYFRDRVSWAITYLASADFLERPERGVVQITKQGKKFFEMSEKNALENISVNALLLLSKNFQKFRSSTIEYDVLTIEDFFKKLSQDENFRAIVESNSKKQMVYFQKSSEGGMVKEEESDINNSLTPEEELITAHEKYLNTMKAQILEGLFNLSPEKFEKIVVKILTHLGYGIEKLNHATKLTRDHGIDGVLYMDILKLDRIAIQAKRNNKDSVIGSDKIQNFSGALDGGNFKKGIFVTTSYFSSEAKKNVERASKDISLIDGNMLVDIMIEKGIGISIKTPTIKLFDIDEEFFIVS